MAKDIAYCRNCNLAQSLSALASGTVVNDDVDLTQPPAGAWFRRDPDGMTVGATNRSLGGAFGLLFFALFWNGIVGMFVLLALSATLHQLGIVLPSWFPAFAAKSNSQPLGFIIFLWVFLTPFIAIGLAVFGGFLNALAGRTEIRLQNGHGDRFTGIGPIGFHKRFEAADVRNVRIEEQPWRNQNGNSQPTTRIIIETTNQTIQFGSMFTYERRRFVAAALKKELSRR
ncbi:MAG TPA: hypothetical protein VNX46_06915 [Candidatus Acidoferrum sp.]|nr:hypothetical protein [Candidatus Acidoferrum sp.]